jgi:glycine/D-amino acid oxidase-like deaminating enzyme
MRICIIGAGAVGSATALFLMRLGGCDVQVQLVERDPTYARASSALSASSIRQQFSQPVNIAVSQFGNEFLHNIHQHLAVDGDVPEIGLTERGYLYLATEAGAATLRENHATQRAMGVEVALLEPAQLRQRFPWLNVDDLALGSLGLKGEGWFDGYGLLMAFKQKARSLGVQYLKAEATGFAHSAGRVTAVALQGGTQLPCDWAVNAAGAWARPLMANTGLDLPVYGRRRCVYGFASPAKTPGCPLVIDTSGLWFRPEGDIWICGLPPAEGNDDNDAPLDVDHELFDQAWLKLAHRVPGFEALRLQRAWAGYYEYNTLDHNALLGPHPLLPNLLLANGFSGHGLQQSPAVGRGLAEWICEGTYTSLDLSPLAAGRLVSGEALVEKNVI